MTKYDDPLQEAAYLLGRAKGADFATLLIDRKTDVDTAKALIEGYDNSDDTALALCPNPLSGEYDGSPLSAMSDIAGLAEAEGLLKKTNIEEALDAAEDVLEVYENAYREWFWITAIKRANIIVEVG